MYLNALNEAMQIDSNYAGNKKILQHRENHTLALLLSLFDVGHHRYGEVQDDGERRTSNFNDYAIRLQSARQNGDKWIQDNCETYIMNQHRVLVGWCYAMSQQLLLLNYCYLSKQLYDSLHSSTTKPSFILDDLLIKIGIGHNLSDVNLGYDMCLDNVNDFKCTLVDYTTNIPVTTTHHHRPIQEDVMENLLDEKGTISRLGQGWSTDMIPTWFYNTTTPSSECTPVKISNGRNISSVEEAKESLIILKTLSTVCLHSNNEFGRNYYDMQC